MKTSTQIFGEIENVLARVRRLHGEAAANESVRGYNHRLTVAEEKENERRRNRSDQIRIEIASANAEAARLRKAYAKAVESERAPQPAGPSPALQDLYKRRDDGHKRLQGIRVERSQIALAAAEGDAKAEELLAKCCEDQASAETELQNLTLAIEQAEARDAEMHRELADSDADEKYRAGLAAADDLVAWSAKFDNLLDYVAAHFAKLPDLQKRLAKSGADINTDLTNRLFNAAARDRAAKQAGLHRIFSIDATGDATPLGEAFRSILRAAVRRPKPKGEAA